MASIYLPDFPELPGLTDTRTSGLRLQATSAKALPAIKNVGSQTNVRQMEIEQYANDMRAAFAISKAYEKRSRAIARAKNRMMEKAAKNFGVR